MKNPTTIVSLLAGALLAIGGSRLAAQEIDATVTVDAQRLPLSSQQEVAGFAEEMRRYLNTTRWTNEEWEGDKVGMNFSVIFDNVTPDGIYTARVLAGSQRGIYKSTNQSPMMKVLDEGWTFHYSRNQPFQQDLSRYDELTGLIDFYVYIALGLDFDSYGYLGGSAMFARAMQIAERAQVRQDLSGWSTQTTPGSYSRYGFVRELTDLRFSPLRKFIYDYHYIGLDGLARDRGAALDSINNSLGELVKTIDRLVQPTTIVRVLNDAKNIEYSQLFIGYNDPMVWKKLLYIDPGHQSVYEAARNR
jgi:hypothetical protein